LLDLKFNHCGRVKIVALHFWELLHRHQPVVFLSEPKNNDAALAQKFEFLVAGRAPVSKLFLLVFR
jgi:hypothetical protein